MFKSDDESAGEELKMEMEVNEPGVENVNDLVSILPRGVAQGRMGVQNMGHTCYLAAGL